MPNTFASQRSPPSPSSPPHDSDAPFPPFTPGFSADDKIEYEEPLYTEINIPLPSLPAPPKSLAMQQTPSSTPTTTTSAQTHTPLSAAKHSRNRARSLSSFSFRSRSSSSSSSSSSSPSPRHSTDDSWPRIRPSMLRSRETAAAMDLGHAGKRGRSGTVDALAVVPAVLVLSAELFTPGAGGKSGSGRGMVEGMR